MHMSSTAKKAQEAGKIRHIGVTSHSLPMAISMVRTGLFSTVQFPFNFIEGAAATELLPVVRERGMGFLVMKPFGGGVIDNARVAFRYLRHVITSYSIHYTKLYERGLHSAQMVGGRRHGQRAALLQTRDDRSRREQRRAVQR